MRTPTGPGTDASACPSCWGLRLGVHANDMKPFRPAELCQGLGHQGLGVTAAPRPRVAGSVNRFTLTELRDMPPHVG